ncbi:glycosyltransferase [Thermoproteus tenax]|uniref:Trehalose glycosyltransferring synthase n=2 Tax=Thermoproteus tenax TaxID=2271 RepID=G4RMV2_THETK|nr:glycosyltransferase [Thermoproteus tenax]CAF18522.1 trehalose phosphorylase/synthase [Thermoproteus tenax]CCC80896.1 trehalose glycosyltransferring synthase [Thermoproteus tenax Kra 1]
MIERYVEFIGEHELNAIFKYAERLRDLSILHINSTAAGGGVAEILHRLIPLMRELGLNVEWKVIRGNEEFFRVTKSFHNALQTGAGSIPREYFEIYDRWQEINAGEIPLDYDVVFIHDPQPAGLIRYKRRGVWIWRCHIDISNPHPEVWAFLKRYISAYDGVIVSIPEFARDDLDVPQISIPPSIDPLSPKNVPLPRATVDRIVRKYGVDPERPIVLQVSRFDRAKDPVGVIEAYKLARRHVDVQLVYLGSPASDDPEGEEVYREALRAAGDDKDIHLLMLPPNSHIEVNAFQRAAAVVLQKSIREGFGLTVSEALWKRRPVIGGNTGGIRIQVIHGVTGFLVDSPKAAAHYIVYLLKNKRLRREMGAAGREHVRRNFLITQQLRRYLMTILYLTGRHSAP